MKKVLKSPVCSSCNHFESSKSGAVKNCHALRYTGDKSISISKPYVAKRMTGDVRYCKSFDDKIGKL